MSISRGWHPPSLPREPDEWHPPLLEHVSRSRLELAEGEDEISMLREVYGNVLNKGATLAYAHFGDHGWQYRVQEYLDDRDAFFGSKESYAAYAQAARTELDANDEKLRGKIDPPTKSRPGLPRWREAQVCFYAWTRRAYENALGSGVNIPALISAGVSEKLRAALKQVRADYANGFLAETMNPRPIKTPRGYRLGTLSDHAVGTAVDIDTARNAQIEATEWAALLRFTGKSLDVSARKAKWKTSPLELHAAITEINAFFVSKLQQAVVAEMALGQSDAEALASAVKADADLTRVGTSFIKRWRNGFFDLPWALVKELHEETFLWGATFARLDLHHFELN